MVKNNDTTEKKRGRGRPKINKSARTVSIKTDDDITSNENLILKLNISDSESEKDNPKHTMISISSKYYSDSDSSAESNNSDDTNDSDDSNSSDSSDDSTSSDDADSSDESTSSSSSSDDSGVSLLSKYKKLIKENKKLKKTITDTNILVNNLKNNLKELQFEERLNTGANEAAIVKPFDMKLIDISSGKSVVVEKTNKPCWWCFHKFDEFPWFLPDYQNNGKYYVFGCFCAVNCASAYNDNLNDYKVDKRRMLLKQYYREITKTSAIVDIIPAPPRELLLSGALSIEQFREKHISVKKEYRTKIPPVIPLILNLETHNKK